MTDNTNNIVMTWNRGTELDVMTKAELLNKVSDAFADAGITDGHISLTVD